MNLQIYQAYYLPDQIPRLDSNFIPYDNTNGDHDLLEYVMWKNLYEKHKHTDAYWGVLSWRWREKINFPGNLLKSWIRANPDYDGYFVNPWYHLLPLKNLWIQGEFHHPGLVAWCDRLLSKLGYNFSITELEYTAEEYCTCHYFIGNEKFWNAYLSWLDQIISIAKSDSELNYLMFEHRGPHRERNYLYFPFIVERLFAIFMILNPSVKIKSYHYDSFLYNQDPNLLACYYDKRSRESEILAHRKQLFARTC